MGSLWLELSSISATLCLPVPHVSCTELGCPWERGTAELTKSSVSDLGAWHTVGAQKRLVDSEGPVISLGLPSAGYEARTQGQTWQQEAWPCSVRRAGKGRWIAQVSVEHPGLPQNGGHKAPPQWRSRGKPDSGTAGRKDRRRLVHNLSDSGRAGELGTSWAGTGRSEGGRGPLGPALPLPPPPPAAPEPRARTQEARPDDRPTNGGWGRGRRVPAER